MESLRPSRLHELRGQSPAIARLESLAAAARDRRVVPPHLLLHGPPGVGKTTAARAFALEVLGADYENSFNQLDSGDDRSAEFLKRRIAPLTSLPPSRGATCRVIFFDDAENLTDDAQGVLRPILERELSSTVFVLACNDLARLSAPIRSRCLVLEFPALPNDDLRRVVLDALAKTPFRLEGSRIDAIVARAEGIPREAIKLLVEEGARSAPTGG